MMNVLKGSETGSENYQFNVELALQGIIQYINVSWMW